MTGKPKSLRDKIKAIIKIIEDLEETTKYGAPEEEIFNEAEKIGIERDKVKEILAKLREDGTVYCPKNGYYRIGEY